MKRVLFLICTSLILILGQSYAHNKNNQNSNKMNSTTEHYTFELSDEVTRQKVHFKNRFGIELTADLYIPKKQIDSSAAIAIGGPFGAVKEQASGLYANQMAARGFIALAFDPSYTGESGGEPRYVASPDINTEDFCAAVDFLSILDGVNPDCIGIIGICGWGGTCSKRCCNRHSYQSYSSLNDVQHEPCQCQWLFRCNGCERKI